MTYSEKLKDPRWQRKRLEIMQRDDFTCRNCGAKDKTLNIHHIRYLNGLEPWEYREFYLVTLCEDCHSIEEKAIISGDYKVKEQVTERVQEKPKHHRIVLFLAHLIAKSNPAMHVVLERFSEIKEAEKWIEGAGLIERVSGAINRDSLKEYSRHCDEWMRDLSNDDRAAMKDETTILEGMPKDAAIAADHALSVLGITVLQRRDAKIKFDIKQRNVPRERLIELLDEAKEIGQKLRYIQRTEFDDELPAATFKPKPRPRWQGGNK